MLSWSQMNEGKFQVNSLVIEGRPCTGVLWQMQFWGECNHCNKWTTLHLNRAEQITVMTLVVKGGVHKTPMSSGRQS